MTAIVKLRPSSALIALCLCIVIGYEVTNDATATVSIVCGCVGTVVLFILPVRYLLPIALATTLLVPTNYLPLPTVVHATSLGVYPLVVWILRSKRVSRGPMLTRTLAWTLAAWMLASELFAPIRTNHGIEWLGLTLATIITATVTSRRDFNPDRLRQIYLQITSFLGGYALIETYILRSNPIYGHFYATATPPLLQHWSQYRATTLLGHPLVNGTVFASALALTASEATVSKSRTRWWAVRLVLLVGGLAATGSRGAAAAAACGVVLAILFARSPAKRMSRKLAALACTVLLAAVIVVVLSARSESREGQSSTADRLNVPAQTEEAMRGTSFLGAGPGESQAYRELRRVSNPKQPLENGYAQLVVSLGLVGAALFLATLVSVCVVGLRSGRRVDEACALATVLVAVAGYNALEDYPNLLVLIALLVIAVLSGSTRRTTDTPVPLRRTRIMEAA